LQAVSGVPDGGSALPAPEPGEARAAAGVLAGIARHAMAKGPMEVLDTAVIGLDFGVEGDFRGRRKPGGTGKRQVTLMERGDWEAATAELGIAPPWWERRCNLLVEGFDLPQRAGARLRIGADVVLEVTVEDDPCTRMDQVAPGLMAALVPDWRGGACARVLAGGTIVVGDQIRIEEP
jgi:MOSC domain-containing protein YiiM